MAPGLGWAQISPPERTLPDGIFFPLPLYIAIPTGIVVLLTAISAYRRGTLTTGRVVVAALAGAVALAIPKLVETVMLWIW